MYNTEVHVVSGDTYRVRRSLKRNGYVLVFCAVKMLEDAKVCIFSYPFVATDV